MRDIDLSDSCSLFLDSKEFFIVSQRNSDGRVLNSLMKVVRDNRGFTYRQRLHPRCFYRNHIIDVLKTALDQKEFASNDSQTVLSKQIWSDDSVRDTRFIL